MGRLEVGCEKWRAAA